MDGWDTVAPHLQYIAGINNDCILDWLCRDKRPRAGDILDLETPTVVLEEQGDGAPVRMRHAAGGPFLLQILGRDGQVMQQTQVMVLGTVFLGQVVFVFQTESHSDRTQDSLGDLAQFLVQIVHGVSEAWEGFFRKPSVWLAGDAFAAHVEDFLVHRITLETLHFV